MDMPDNILGKFMGTRKRCHPERVPFSAELDAKMDDRFLWNLSLARSLLLLIIYIEYAVS
jgi:hypothetical protein